MRAISTTCLTLPQASLLHRQPMPTPTYAPGLWTFGTMNRPRYFGAEVQYKF